MEMMNWVNEVDNEVARRRADVLAESGQWTKRCIYRLPAHVTDLDDKAYKPQVVSLEALAQVVRELKDAYDQLDPVWQDDTNAFLKMMVLDGCFILEILRMDTTDYAPNDPLFSTHGKLYMLPFLRKDMLLLENQPHEYVNKRILRFYSPGKPQRSLGNCLHLLDVYRKSLLHRDLRRSTKRRRFQLSHRVEYGLIPSASELQDAGIRFKKSAGNEVTSYVFFLYNLIRDPTDAHVLSSHGIISNYLGSDFELAILFHLVSRYVTIDPESSLDTVYLSVCQKLTNRFTTTLNEWQADFIRTYFKSPWAAISVVAAILYFGLTITQTTYSVLSYIHRNCLRSYHHTYH
ncbi:UNVERIFIED_CONTAM: hypothetical protein Slati_1850100 [Sesamum latifolium]|uniref:Uncharacterized protein n=1 Tax=Sesamum latifolium TaxID=2727402 RepID=A0AAW2WZ71_9LAMI